MLIIMNNFKYYIIIRFNLRIKNWSDTTENQSKVPTKWFNMRINLFQNYCLPSVNKRKVGNYNV